MWKRAKTKKTTDVTRTALRRAAIPGSDPTDWECHRGRIMKESLQPDSQTEAESELIDFVAQHTPTEDPSTDGSPREDKNDHDLLKSAIFEMLEGKSETVRPSKELSLSRLAEKEEFQLLVGRLAPYFMCPRLPHALTELLRPRSLEGAE
nr:unnamed protein product [Spirometra erinaceieuropaei]